MKNQNPAEKFIGPMMTAIGIILGFLLAFTATWVSALPNTADWSDAIIGVGLFTSIIFHIIAMYRVLNNEAKEDENGYYRKTLRIFIFGLSITLFSLVISTIQTVITPIA